MTREEAKYKLDFIKKGYQKLIDEKVDSGKLVGDGVRGEWKAETPLDEVYKDMIEALNMAIEALKQESCEDCISRQAAIETAKQYWYKPDIAGALEELPSVQPKPKTGHWVLLDECSNSGYYCSECHKKVVKEGWSNTVKKIKYCPNCGCRMVEPQESEDKE
jgi:hypothetical protein